MSEGTGRLLCGQALGAWPCGHYGKDRVQQPHRASHSRRAALPQQAQHPSSFHVIDSKAPAQRHGGTGGQTLEQTEGNAACGRSNDDPLPLL